MKKMIYRFHGRVNGTFTQLNNPYAAIFRNKHGRSCIAQKSIDQNNLDGGVTDLGTGSGIGLLALRRIYNQTLHGVDNDTYF